MKRILCYGDSNTFGTAPMSGLGVEAVHPRGVRWPDVMGKELGAGHEVIVEGLPGRTTVFDDPVEGEYRNGLRTLLAILHSHKPIDLLIVALGTNDQKLRFRLGAQDIALGLARLVTEARASGTVGEVLVVAPPAVALTGDLGEMFRGAPERCAGLTGWIERVAGAEGAEVFDAGKVIVVDPLDGIHWSAASHARLGAALAEVAGALLG